LDSYLAGVSGWDRLQFVVSVYICRVRIGRDLGPDRFWAFSLIIRYLLNCFSDGFDNRYLDTLYSFLDYSFRT
jgi:hypothetical protein